MAGGPALVFERISPGGMPLLRLWRALGRPVYALSTADSLKGDPAIEGLRRLTLERRGHYLYEGHASALAAVEVLYASTWKGHPLIERLAALYGSSEVERSFKKEMNAKLSDFYSVRWTIKNAARLLAGERFVYVPSSTDGVHFLSGAAGHAVLARRLRAAGCDPLDEPACLVPAWLGLWDLLLALRERADAAARGLGASGWLALNALGAESTEAPIEARVGVNVVAPQRQFANEVQNAGFLVDGASLKAEDTLIVSGLALAEPHRKALDLKGLRWIDDLKRRLSPSAASAALPAAINGAAEALFGDAILGRTAALLAYQYAKWSGVLERTRLRHFVSYCDMMDLQTIPRNILMRRVGVQTWFYLDSSHVMCYYASAERPLSMMVHKAFSYMLYDHFVSWSKELTDFYVRHRGAFSAVHEVGCLWAEHLTAAAAKGGGALAETVKAKSGGRRIVAVFDSTYNDESMTTYADGAAFAAGVLTLAAASPDAFVVVKEKTAHARFPDARTRAAYEELARHERVLILAPRESPSELMALSDLVVSFPFTSTSFEALAAGRKALWFDATDKFRGTFFDAVPGLVCHDAAALKARCAELLAGRDADWKKFVAERVRGTIEPYCDGRALTRWRELLA